MAELDREIDRLYQLPLSEFTAARKALAGDDAEHRTAITRLQKPSVAAWTVNQLFWRERKTYDALVAASERLRAAQAAMLKGGQARVPEAEAAHAAALKAASDTARDILRDAGEAASSATMTAVHETLQAVPSSEPPGRLTRPLKPLGFEALAGLLKGKAPAKRATVLPFKPQTNAALEKAEKVAAKQAEAEARRRAESERREAEARTKEIAKLKQDLRAAQSAERTATAAIARARDAVERAEQDFQRRRNEASDAVARRREIENRLKTLT